MQDGIAPKINGKIPIVSFWNVQAGGLLKIKMSLDC
jgi:hypothetical protein